MMDEKEAANGTVDNGQLLNCNDKPIDSKDGKGADIKGENEEKTIDSSGAALSSPSKPLSDEDKAKIVRQVEVSDDGSKIRRHPDNPLPEEGEERRDALLQCTVYVKNFPQTVTIDDLLAFFPQDDIDHIYMRRHRDALEKKHVFKGSVLVTFKTKEKAQAYLAQDAIKYQDAELIKMWQKEWLEEKKQEKQKGKEQQKAMKEQQKKEKQEAAKYVAKYEQARKGKKENEERKDGEGEEGEGEGEPEAEERKGFPKGTVLQLKGIVSGTSWKDIKAELEKFEADIAFIKYSKGDSEAYVRLQEENSASEIKKKIDESEKKVEVHGAPVEVCIMAEDEEEEFLRKEHEQKEKTKGKKRFQGKRRGRGGGPPGKRRRAN
ncbi:unnamed protein product [Darwinula stevensoni]|nr:unnamed protein product [Darwinula stevensoni]CAG0900831.1 unnamed protein product [Darwinula stevensoni]